MKIAAALTVLTSAAVVAAQPSPPPPPTASFPLPAPTPDSSAPAPVPAPVPVPAPSVPSPPPIVVSPEARVPPPPPAAPKPPEPPPAPRNWNLGAGLSFGSAFSIGKPVLNGAYLLPEAPLPLRLSLEKSLGTTTWLMLNAAFSHTADDVPVVNLADPSESRVISLTTNSVVGTVGVRQILVSGIVDFSVFGGLELGNVWVDGQGIRPEEFAPGTQAGSSTMVLGILAGIAVERELVEGLSLRIPVNVATVSWLWATTKFVSEDDIETTKLKRSGFGVVMDPAIELRLYF